MSLNGATASWEESQRQLIAQDTGLLENFQVLKYINGGCLSTIMTKAGVSFTSLNGE